MFPSYLREEFLGFVHLLFEIKSMTDNETVKFSLFLGTWFFKLQTIPAEVLVGVPAVIPNDDITWTLVVKEDKEPSFKFCDVTHQNQTEDL